MTDEMENTKKPTYEELESALKNHQDALEHSKDFINQLIQGQQNTILENDKVKNALKVMYKHFSAEQLINLIHEQQEEIYTLKQKLSIEGAENGNHDVSLE